MQTPDSTKNTSPDVNKAEQAVNSSIAQFETAMENLADKVEDTSQRVQHIVEVAQKPVEDLVELKDRVQEAAAPIVREVRSNPRPWIITAAFLAAGFFFLTYLQKNNRLT